MTRLDVTAVSPGTTVQDGGRFGAQRYGLTPSGAVDRLALVAANVLIGNAPFAAAIEIGPLHTVFTARGGPVQLGLTGATRPADVAGRAVPLNSAFTLAVGESLNLGLARGGVFSYLAIEGGVQGEPMFGSLSVNARFGLGSPYPRPLQVGDELQAGAASDAQPRRIDLPAMPDGAIRLVMGPQDDEFGDDAKALLLDSEWRISATSDRMGYRLEGPVIKHLHGHNIVSDGTVQGSIQLPGNGQPIVLMPDRGTSGGYPKIATVISADLGRFGQTPAGRGFRFRAVTMAEAQAEYQAMDALLRSLAGRVHDTTTLVLDVEALHSANVAGAAVNAFDARTWQTYPAPDGRQPDSFTEADPPS